MAFASGKQTTDGASVARYIGVAPVYVLGVNPTKSELEGFYNTSLDKEPEYTGNKDNVPFVRIDFIVKTDAPRAKEIDLTTKVSFFLRREKRVNRDNTKVQVIDKYGRTAWVTNEQLKAHEIPMYTNGPANLDADYRPVYNGEEKLTDFIKTYLNISNVQKYVNGAWVMVDNPQDCEARLEHIEDYFKGNFQELKGIIAMQPNNKVKALFGVRASDGGSLYQDVYTDMFLRNNASDYSRLDKDVQERKNAGAYPNSLFTICELREYTVEATNLDSPTVEVEDDPWA